MGGIKDLFGIPKWLDQNGELIDFYLRRIDKLLLVLAEFAEEVGGRRYADFIEQVRSFVKEADELNDLSGEQKRERVFGLLADAYGDLPESIRNTAIELLVQVTKFSKDRA